MVLRFLFSRPVQVLVALLLLWAWIDDAGCVRTWSTQLLVDHAVSGVQDALLPSSR